jgi:trimethylamine--corrinoid protein Co-methyltransferase
MQREYVYPAVGDRTSPNQWVEQGRPTVVDRASQKLNSILEKHYPTHISDEVDARIREKLPIRLPREAMRPKGTVPGG